MNSNVCFAIFFILLLSSCSSSKNLKTGIWTGSMTPMNHPEMTTELQFEVGVVEGKQVISIKGPGDINIPTHDVVLNDEGLSFQFNEPEQFALLNCNFKGNNRKGFIGRCEDESGKWAQFTMSPPK